MCARVWNDGGQSPVFERVEIAASACGLLAMTITNSTLAGYGRQLDSFVILKSSNLIQCSAFGGPL